MKRYNVFLTEKQIKLLKKTAKNIGIKPAELLRRIIDTHFGANR